MAALMSNVITLPSAARLGATVEQWQRLAESFYLKDLLPVVCNPLAEISPHSTMKTIGKTPSCYNAQRQVVGLTGWTAREATSADVRVWQQNPDYGICLQTRRVRALDVDVPDPQKAEKIKNAIISTLDLLDITLPERFRRNSGKFLFAFEVEGNPEELYKSAFRVDGGIIEFLARGQQFVAVGTHDSGARYEWTTGDIPQEFPRVPYAVFAALWAMLQAQFGTAPASEATAPIPTRLQRRATDINDRVADFLESSGWVKSYTKDGRYNILCPFNAEHTTDSGDTATQYFPAGVGGFEVGHFKCLHAHCEHRSDGDFLQAINYGADFFDDETESAASRPRVKKTTDDNAGGKVPRETADITQHLKAVEPGEYPDFLRDKNGNIDVTIGNIIRAVESPAFCQIGIAYDMFTDGLLYAPVDTADWQPFADHDYTELRDRLEKRGFKKTNTEIVRDAVHLVAQRNKMDAAILWLESLKWDGVPRVDSFLTDYLGAEPGAYSEAVSRYIWTALAGRVLEPGCKVDMVPVFVGAQGLGKSELIAEMVPSREHAIEIDLLERDDNLSRSMRGALIGEIAELKGLHSKDQENIKAFITRRFEKWIPKFKEFRTTYARRLLMLGTTNENYFLTDPTGNRRWLPVDVQFARWRALAGVRNQLWAEGAALFLLDGIAWENAEALARLRHADYMIEDSWTNAIRDWLDGTDDDTPEGLTRGDGLIQTAHIAVQALGIREKELNRGVEHRIGRTMRALGYIDRRIYMNHRRRRGWVKLGHPSLQPWE